MELNFHFSPSPFFPCQNIIFGRKQQGPEAIKANNVFFYLTYYGSVDVASIEDEALRQATELQIAHFGQCPMQLFVRPHVRRIQHYTKRMSFYQVTSAYTQGAKRKEPNEDVNENVGMNDGVGSMCTVPVLYDVQYDSTYAHISTVALVELVRSASNNHQTFAFFWRGVPAD